MKAFTIPDVIAKTRTGQAVNDMRVAFTFNGVSHSYDELYERSTSVAAGLLADSFRKGDRVAILMRNRPEWIELFFGLTGIGGVVVPLNYLLRVDELESIVTDSGATWIVYEDEFIGTVDELRTRLTDLRGIGVDEPVSNSGSYTGLLAKGTGTHPFVDIASDDLALLQYTSGTTGRPKGVMHTHSTILWNSYHQIVDFGVSRDDTYYVLPALCWAAGWHDLALATLWMGGRLVVKDGTSFEPEEFLATVEYERVTKVLLVPTVLKRVLAAPELDAYDLTSLQMVISGGEPVPVTASQEMRHRLPWCSVLQVYGLSEFPSLMLLLGAEDADRKAGSTGKACSVAQVRVVDGHGRDVTAGETGEIICKSPAVMTGYYRRPEATAETLVDGWLHTGDLAAVDDEGYVFVVGRAKDMLITGGLNVYPAEVERILAQHPAIMEAAVVGVADEQWGEVGQAHIVPQEGHSLTESDLLPWLREQLATFKVPRQYVFRSELLPRTTSGKVQKFVLRVRP